MSDNPEQALRDATRVIGDLQKQVAQSIPYRYGDFGYEGVTAASLGLRDVRIDFARYGGPYITQPGYGGEPSNWIANVHGVGREKQDRAYFIANAINYHDDLVRLVLCLIDNDPDDDVADAARLLDVWRQDAERLLRSLKPVPSITTAEKV